MKTTNVKCDHNVMQHLFLHPFCSSMSCIKKIGIVAFHFFTVCIPLIVMHTLRCICGRKERRNVQIITPDSDGTLTVDSEKKVQRRLTFKPGQNGQLVVTEHQSNPNTPQKPTATQPKPLPTPTKISSAEKIHTPKKEESIPLLGTIQINDPSNSKPLGIVKSANHMPNIILQDDQEWQANDNEMMIQCKIALNQHKEIFKENIYLPLCLFINNNYLEFKKNNDEIIFFYKFNGKLYQCKLTITHKDSLISQIQICERFYYINQTEKKYLSPTAIPKLQLEMVKSSQLKFEFYQQFKINSDGIPQFEHPFKLEYEIKDNAICCSLIDCQYNPIKIEASDVKMLFSKTHCAIHFETKASTTHTYRGVPVPPQEKLDILNTNHFLALIPFSQSITKDSIENAEVKITKNHLVIHLLIKSN